VVQLLHVGKKHGKKAHRLRKGFRGGALCFPFPAAASSKGGEGLWVWLACPDSAAHKVPDSLISPSFNRKSGEVVKEKKLYGHL